MKYFFYIFYPVHLVILEGIAMLMRLVASLQAGEKGVLCVYSAGGQGMAALVENLQRQDLDYIEEAQGIDLLLRRWNMSQEQVAKLLGKSQSGVANKLRLLRHSPKVLEALRQGELTERHARALLKLPTDVQKLQAIGVIVKQAMSVSRAEQYIETLLNQDSSGQSSVSVGAFLSYLNQSLARIQLSGISAVSERRETDSQIVLTITIPKT